MLAKMLPEISAQELAESLSGERPPQLAEILGPEYFASGHLPGAINLPLEGFAENALRLLPDKQADIVVYCHHGTRSARAVEFLRAAGYSKVRNLTGGIDAWATQVDVDTPRY